MPDFSERLNVSLNDPAPKREKRAYNKREPVRPDPVRIADPVRQEEVRPKKVRMRKNQSLTAPLDLPIHVLERFGQMGIDLQWVTNTIAEKPAIKERQEFVVNAWEPVTADMWDGFFDGMYTPRGHKGEITYDACVLMWRPMELTLEARAEEREAARAARGYQERNLKSGRLPGVNPDMLNPDHQSAKSVTRLTTTHERYIPVPKE